MPKLLLMSILIMTLVIPIFFSKSKSAKAGLRKTIYAFAVFLIAWEYFSAFVYAEIAPKPRFNGKEIPPDKPGQGQKK